MLQVKIVNDGTGNEKVGNYDYVVSVNSNIIAQGRLENFERKKGWESLLLVIAGKELYRKGERTMKECQTLFDWGLL